MTWYAIPRSLYGRWSFMSAHPTVIPMGDNPPQPTQLPDAFLSSREALALAHFHIPRYDELPSLPLYREQVIGYIENHMAPLSTDPSEALITSSMVNNYIKAGLIAAPQKKRYLTEHIARLMAVCIMKQVLPIASVQKLFEIQMRSYEVGVAYNYLVTEVEHALEATFSTVDLQPDSAIVTTRESLLVRSMAAAFAAKLYLMAYLRYLG